MVSESLIALPPGLPLDFLQLEQLLQVREHNVLTVFNADPPPLMSVKGGGVLCREVFKNVLADFVR